jgi:hypothetical protein
LSLKEPVFLAVECQPLALKKMYTENLMQEKNVYKKSRGRPLGSQYAGAIPVRLSPEIRDLVDQYAKDAEVNRSRAIRELLEEGLRSAEYLEKWHFGK